MHGGPRRIGGASVVTCVAIVAVALGGAAGVGASAGSDARAAPAHVGPASADPAPGTPRSGGPQLAEPVPEDAEILVPEHSGRGDSGRLRFRSERDQELTVAFACAARGRTRGAVVALGGITARSRCHQPLTVSVSGDRAARQWLLQVDAPSSVRWVLAVYDGRPGGTSAD